LKINFLKAKIPFSVYIIVFLLILIAGVLNVIFNKPSSFMENKDLAIDKCIQECLHANTKGIILTEGPCLSEEIVKGWACDVVNQPKISIVDNNPKNQCKSYIEKNISHQVVISTKCELVSAK
jgi:hypothetical protein